MSLFLAALLLPAAPVNILPVSFTTSMAASSETDGAAAAKAAERFLDLGDAGQWAESYAATGIQFRELNTFERWSEVSEKVRSAQW